MSTKRETIPHVDDPRAVGRRLRETRERVEISQRALSFPGCSPAYLSRIEAGDRTPSLQVLRELARRLGVTEEYLAYGVEQQPRSNPLFEAELAVRMDELDRAESLYRAELEATDIAGRRAEALEGLGHIAFRRNQLAEAIDLFEEAKSLFGDEAASRSALQDALGRAYAFSGDPEMAAAIYRKSFAHAEERQDVLDQVRFAVLLSAALTDAGRIEAAEEALAPALALVDDLSDPSARIQLYWAQCRLHAESGHPDLAERYGRKLLDLLERTEDSRLLGRALRLMVIIELDRDRPAEALELLDRAQLAFGDVADPAEHAMLRLLEARALAQVGELDQAATVSMRVAGELSNRPDEAGQMYALLGATFAERGDRTRAIELYELACELLEQSSPTRYLVDAYAKLAEVLEAEGRQGEAFAVLKKAVGVSAVRSGQEASGR